MAPFGGDGTEAIFGFSSGTFIVNAICVPSGDQLRFDGLFETLVMDVELPESIHLTKIWVEPSSEDV